MSEQNEETIFSAAIGVEDPAERQAYVARACGDDTSLRANVEALLRAHDSECLLDIPLSGQETVEPNVRLSEGPGTVIGRYKLLEKIGEGGMAVVYMAEQEQPIHRRVALKVIKLGMDTQQVIARFEAERQALAMMDHPNIAQVFDAGTTDTGRPYFVMELVTGVSITEYCDKNRLSTKERLALFIRVCNAVQHAHQKGIIHRDIKPSNVMVTHCDGKPVPKVIDFGIAKATNQRLTEKTLFTRYAHLIGTPAYMSPEQAELSDLDIDTRSDIYSLGVLLYELLTDTTPFSEEELRRGGYTGMQRIIREQEPTKPSTRLTMLGETLSAVAGRRSATPVQLRRVLRGDLDWIVMKCLEKERMRRYDTVSALAADVECYLHHEPVSAGPPSLRYLTRKFVQRRRSLVIAATAVILAILAGLAASMTMFFQAERARRETDAARAEARSVADFLANDLLATVYPERTRGEPVTVRYILNNAERGLAERFVDSSLAEAEVRDALGRTYQKLGDYDAAETHFERALQIRRQQLGAEDPLTLASLNQLGQLYSQQGRYAEAEVLLTQALDLRTRLLGQEHPDTLESMSDLAWQYACEARFEEGMALASQALQIGRQVLGDEHPIVLKAMISVVLPQAATLNYAEVEGLAAEGHDAAQRVLGAEHEITLSFLNALTCIHRMRGETDVAVELAQQALETGRRVFGEEHAVTILAMSNLGRAYLAQGRLEEAAPLLTRSAELVSEVLGEDHAATVIIRFSLSYLLAAQGRYDERDALLLDVFEASRQMHGEYHPQSGYIRYWLRMRVLELGVLGRRQYESGDYEAVVETFKRSEEIRKALFGRPAPSEVAYRAMALHRLAQYDEACTELRRLRQMYEYGQHACEPDPLCQAEGFFAAGDSEAKRVWALIEAGQLDEALVVVEGFSTSNAANGGLATEGRQSLAKALARAYCRQAAIAQVEREYGKAESSLKAAVRVCPDYALPLQRLAWLRATCPVDALRDKDEAISLATRACELTRWENAACLEALAAGCAEARDFTRAVAWQEQAIERLPAEAHQGQRTVCDRRLRLYRSRRPCRCDRAGSLVARWDFDRVVGKKVVDVSGNGLDGVLVGKAAIVTDPERGPVLYLPGEGYVDCGTSPAFDLTGPMTVAAWIKIDGFDEAHQSLVVKGEGAWGFQRRYSTSTLCLGGAGLEVPEDSTPTLERRAEIDDGRWHHVAGVYDGTRLLLYVDGSLDASTPADGIINTNDVPLFIGGNAQAAGRDWNGWIDDVRLYDYALRQVEVASLSLDDDLDSEQR